jgi:hypothetical protein
MTGIVGYDIQYSYDFVVFLLCWTKSHNLYFCLTCMWVGQKVTIYIYCLIHVSYVGRTKSLILKATPCRNCATVFLPEMRSLRIWHPTNKENQPEASAVTETTTEPV